MQIFFFLAEIRFVLMQAWNDFCLPIGLDNHSVRCKVKCNSNCSPKKRVRATSKGWKPHLNHLPATKSISWISLPLPHKEAKHHV